MTCALNTKIADIIPPLSHHLRKGQSGRVGVIGGSIEYTGAPFFSSMTALKMVRMQSIVSFKGVDLCHVFCDISAAQVIKGYSPDLIVHPYISPKVGDMFKRLDCIVIGPGLGRLGETLDNTASLLLQANAQNLPVVIDADGLCIVERDIDNVKGKENVILTPNENEFKRLCTSVGLAYHANDQPRLTLELAKLLKVCIVRKGKYDTISNGEICWIVDEEAAPRRCGGQGDILSGSIATFMSWHKCKMSGAWGDTKNVDSIGQSNMMCSYAGCVLTRICSRITFQEYGRAMSASNMLQNIPKAFEVLEDKLHDNSTLE